MNRRTFLRGLGGALVTLPVLEALPRSSRLQAGPPATGAKRFVGLMAPDGVVPSMWFPSGTETEFELTGHLAPLQPHREHVIVTKGIDNRAASDGSAMFPNPHIHGVTSLLTGRPARLIDLPSNDWTGSGQSLDQALALGLIAAGYQPQVTSVAFGNEGGAYSNISYVGDGQPVARLTPTQLFTTLFGAGSTTPEELARIRTRRLSVLDGTKGEFARLSGRVSGEDRRRVEAHLEAVREIELRLAAAGVCEAPTVDLSPFNDASSNGAFRILLFDLMVAAMTCDATRVATATFYHSGGGGPQLPFLDVIQDIHELSHQVVAGASLDEFNRYHQWFHGTIAYLVDKLKAVLLPDGKSLFDETVILQGSDISIDHRLTDMPMLVVAGEDTGLRTGRAIQFAPGTPHNYLLTTIAHAFGLDLPGFGVETYAQGDLDADLL